METIIKSNNLQVTIQRIGAELCSVRNTETGIEYIWQADPNHWARHAPVLFPIVGKLKDNKYTHNGQEYSLPQHGFARDKSFELLHCQADEVAYVLNSSATTLDKYPFPFKLVISYTVKVNQLTVKYEVMNIGNDTMYFNIGAHPAFKVPLTPNTVFEDYYLEFSEKENLVRKVLDNGLLTDIKSRVPLKEDQILPLNHQLFKDDALIFEGFRSEFVSLKSKKTPASIKFRIADWPFLGIWSKNKAPFVCIEPWLGHADSQDVNGKLSDKPSIQLLAPSESYSNHYTIDFQ